MLCGIGYCILQAKKNCQKSKEPFEKMIFFSEVGNCSIVELIEFLHEMKSRGVNNRIFLFGISLNIGLGLVVYDDSDASKSGDDSDSEGEGNDKNSASENDSDAELKVCFQIKCWPILKNLINWLYFSENDSKTKSGVRKQIGSNRVVLGRY